VRFTPVPDPFLKNLALEIDDPVEIKVSLYLMWLLHQKKGYPTFVTLNELLSDAVLIQGISREGVSGDEVLRQSLAQAVSRGIFLKLAVDKDGDRQELYFLNTEAGRKAVDSVERGQSDLGRPLPRRKPVAQTVKTSDIFTLYQENIGVLTPLIAEELREAEKTYPASWIEDAFKEAVALNKRNWRYISRILERWSVEGKNSGKSRRDSQKATYSRK
jgi:DnaD/phage-associated family protein